MASGKVLSFVINAIDKVTTPFRKIGSAVAAGCKAIFGNLANIKAGFDMLSGAVRKVGEWMEQAFAFDDLHQQWTQLIGDSDKAREHAEMLWELGETPPFSAEAFSAASRSLQNWGGAALNCRANLVLFGDAAAATGQSVESVADTLGRSFALIRDGADVNRAVMQLQNMKLITPAVADEIRAMSAAGASSAQIWELVTGSLRKYEGGMDAASSSANGMVATLKAKVGTALKDTGNLFLGFAKNEMGYLIHKMDEIRSSGAIIKWANAAKDALRPLAHIVGNLFDGQARTITLQAAWDRLKATLNWAWEQLKAVFVYGGNVVAAAMKAVFTKATLAEGMASANAAYAESRKRANEELRKVVAAADAAIEAAYQLRMEKYREAEAAKAAEEAARRKAESDEAAAAAASALTEAEQQRGQAVAENREAVEAQTDAIRSLNEELAALEEEARALDNAFADAERAAQETGRNREAWDLAQNALHAGRQINAHGDIKRGRDFLDDAKARRQAEWQKKRDDTRAEWNKRQLDRIIDNNSLNLGQLGDRLNKGGHEDITSDRLREGWEKRFAGTAQDLERFKQMLDINDAAKAAREADAAAQQQRDNIDRERQQNAANQQQKKEEIQKAQTELDALNAHTKLLTTIAKNTSEGNFG